MVVGCTNVFIAPPLCPAASAMMSPAGFASTARLKIQEPGHFLVLLRRFQHLKHHSSSG